MLQDASLGIDPTTPDDAATSTIIAISDMRNSVISESSKRSYRSLQVQFLLYLVKVHSDAAPVLSDAFQEDVSALSEQRISIEAAIDSLLETTQQGVGNTVHHQRVQAESQLRSLYGQQKDVQKRLRDKIMSVLKDAPNDPPVDFDKITAELIMTYLGSLKRSDGADLAPTTLGNHRAAIFNLFRDYKRRLSPDMERELSTLMKGLKRIIIQRVVQGDGDIKSGKDPLPFRLYHEIALLLMKSGGTEDIFSHTFLLLTWNLMCRANNTVNVLFQHMSWSGDALCVLFANMKNDQLGERPKDPRHIYANPLMPAVCPILSLGVYLLCFSLTETSLALFPGSSQYARFGNRLNRLFSNQAAELLSCAGLCSADLGTHSIRKGAATYCSSGSTACPSAASVHLRAGWTMGGVQDKYIRYDAAGDQYVGRTVTGLPTCDPQFALLPPHFIDSDSPIDRLYISSVIGEVFGVLPSSMNAIAEFCLASVIYHRDFLFATLPRNHRLFSTSLFTNRQRLDLLSTCVACHLPKPKDSLKSTGIPPHVSLMCSLHSFSSNLQELQVSIAESGKLTADTVIQYLEENAISANTVTYQGLSQALQQQVMATFRELGLDEALELMRSGDAHRAAATTETTNEEGGEGQMVFAWGGRLRRVPEAFILPRVDMLTGFQLWCCGNQSERYPPFRLLTAADMPCRSAGKRLGEFKFVMSKLEDVAKQKGIWRMPLTVVEATNIFHEVFPCIGVSGGSKRASQNLWSTVAKKLRMMSHQ